MFTIVDPDGQTCTATHESADAAWRELISDLPQEASLARSALLDWVGRGYRVVDEASRGPSGR